MRWRPCIGLAALLLAAACARERVEPVGLPPPERGAWDMADAKAIAAWRERAAGLRRTAGGERLYHLAKAEAWLDLAADAGRDEIGAETADAAQAEAAILIAALERGQSPLSRTLHLRASQRVRNDLWGLVEGMKNSAGFRCAAEPLARAEVALVWAGHKAFLGDRKGADEIEARAEWFIDAARGAFRRCIDAEDGSGAASAPAPVVAPPPAPAPRPAPAPAPAPAGATHVEVVQLRTDALFPFGAAVLDDARRASLHELAQRIRAIPGLVAVRVHGHTDRLSRSGPAFNQRLSLSRAQAVRDALVAHGLDAASIDARGHGDAKPLVECPGPRSEATIACLAPNRRVEIEIERAH